MGLVLQVQILSVLAFPSEPLSRLAFWRVCGDCLFLRTLGKDTLAAGRVALGIKNVAAQFILALQKPLDFVAKNRYNAILYILYAQCISKRKGHNESGKVKQMG